MIYLIDKSIISKREVLKIKLFTNDIKSMFFDKEELEKLNYFIGMFYYKMQVIVKAKIRSSKL